MDSAEVIYEDKRGEVKKIKTGKTVPGQPVKAESVEIDEQGAWVMIHTVDSSGNEGSMNLPRERIIAIHEGRIYL